VTIGVSRFFLWFIATILTVGVAAAESAKVTDLGDFGLSGFGSEVRANGINNKGQIAGTTGSPGGFQAFMWEKGTLTRLEPEARQPDLWSQAYDINRLGHVVGHVSLKPVVWVGGTVSYLRMPEDLNASGFASSINDKGEIVGTLKGSQGTKAVAWRDGQVRILGPADAEIESGAAVINNHGEIAGWVRPPDTGVQIAVVWKPGGHVSLLPDPAVQSYALAMNDAGQILVASVGSRKLATWHSGKVRPIEFKQGEPLYGAAMNAKGEVAGVVKSSKEWSIYIWSDRKLRLFPMKMTETQTFSVSSIADFNEEGMMVGAAFTPRGIRPVLIEPKRRRTVY
jgi:uncharacterized membrane protein